MNHRNHLVPCLIAAAVAILLLTTIGTNPIGAGLGVAFLLCPIVMGTVMWLLMRQQKGQNATFTARPPVDIEEHASTGSRP